MQARLVLVFVLTLVVGAVWYYQAHRPKYDITVNLIQPDGSVRTQRVDTVDQAMDLVFGKN